DLNTQLLPLREFASLRGWTVTEEYSDKGHSGAKRSRPALNKLLKDARARKLDVVLVWKFDRFGRDLEFLIRTLNEFRELGVEFVSLTDSVDTSTAAGKAMFGMLAVFAEFERDLLTERVRAGVDRACKQGTVLGRPRVIFDRERALQLHHEGQGVRRIASVLGVSRETVRKVVTSSL